VFFSFWYFNNWNYEPLARITSVNGIAEFFRSCIEQCICISYDILAFLGIPFIQALSILTAQLSWIDIFVYINKYSLMIIGFDVALLQPYMAFMFVCCAFGSEANG
jgi:hypothetical protein